MSEERLKIIPAVYLILKKNIKVNSNGIISCDILFGKRKNSGFCDGMYSLPAGHVEDNDTGLEDAIKRESMEELGGFIPKSLKLSHVLYRMDKFDLNPRKDTRIDLFFENEIHEESEILNIANSEPEKCESLDWIHIEDILNPKCFSAQIIPYVTHAIVKGSQGDLSSSMFFNE